MTSYTWVPIYHEIAEALLPFESNPKDLVDLLTQIEKHGLPIISLKDKNKQEEEIPLEEIDPFTFFATWNRGITEQNRIQIITELQKLLGLNIKPPDDFSGIPVVSSMKSWFFAYAKERAPGDIPLLWKLFREAMTGNISTDTFDSVLKIKSVSYNITMGLFWINANNYLNLDKVNRAYLRTKNIIFDDLKNFSSYTACMSETRKIFGKPFYEISDEAWKSSQGVTIKRENPEKLTHRYWLYAPGEGAKYWDEFYKYGIMAIGWDYLGDLHGYNNKESIAATMREHEDKPDASKKNDATSCYSFISEMSIGDIIFVKRGTSRILGWGIIDSDYYFDNTRDYFKHVRKVKWQDKGTWDVDDSEHFAIKTLTDITEYTEFIQHLKQLIGIDVMHPINQAETN